MQKASGRAVMTRSDHASGSDRIFEALGKVDPGGSAEIIVNLQADLPTIGSADIAAALAPLADAAVDIATLAAEIERAEERDDPNVVKVVGLRSQPSGCARSILPVLPRHSATGRSTTTSAFMPSAGPRSSAS